MRNRQQKELQRLEEALLETEEPECFSGEESGSPIAGQDWEIYNTDDTDVDLEAYSEEVLRGSSGGGLWVVLTMVSMVALAAGILILLKLLEVL